MSDFTQQVKKSLRKAGWIEVRRPRGSHDIQSQELRKTVTSLIRT